MSKLTAVVGVVIAACVWVLLYVILGTGLGTAFIAAGCVAVAGLVAAGMLMTTPVLDAPVTAPSLLLGIATFVILEVVLSVPLWVDVVSALAVTGLYAITEAVTRHGHESGRSQTAAEPRRSAVPSVSHAANGHDRGGREAVGAR
jgi:hypothetical protein